MILKNNMVLILSYCAVYKSKILKNKNSYFFLSAEFFRLSKWP